MENEKENRKFKCYACSEAISEADYVCYQGRLNQEPIVICRNCGRKGITVMLPSEPPAKSKPITDEEYANAFAVFTDNFNVMLNATTPNAEFKAWWKASPAFNTIHRYRLHQLELLQGVNGNE